MDKIELKLGSLLLDIELADTPTAKKVYEMLPINARVKRWGDEIYFRTPVTAQLEVCASECVDIGDLAYWPVDQALCLFFGPTPCSHDDEPRAASAVNVFGRLCGDITQLTERLRQVNNDCQVEVRRKTEH